MKRELRRDRKGNVVVLSAFLMIVMMALAAFAVDVGYIAEARTQLQKSADASALAAAAKLPSLASSTLAATGTATQNQTTITPTLKTSDIVYGYWDRDTSTFTSPKPVGRPYNAVKVTLRRTAANGNPLGLFFGRVLGTHTTDVTATAIGYGDRGFGGPLIGIESVETVGNVTTDSFDSYEGPYDSDNPGSRGSIVSDGSIVIGGDASVRGDVRAGEGETVTISGSTFDVTGQVGNRVTPLALPEVNATAAATTNNNASLPLYIPPPPELPVPVSPLDGSGNFTLPGGVIYNIPQGTYYFNNFTLANGSVLNITGKTTIWVTGCTHTEDGATVNNTTLVPANLQINATGPCEVELRGGGAFYGIVYAPNSDVLFDGGGHHFGVIVGKTLTVSANATAHYDEAIDLTLSTRALRVMLVD
jgi:Flp pilus assembly protein TadG